MVAIKNMKMPKSCWNCNFCYNRNGYYCEISHNLLAREVADIPSENRPTDCPLVEIVTCKDCVKGHKYQNVDECYCDYLQDDVDTDFYCAEGERRE